MPTLIATFVPSIIKGLVVTILIVEPIPPEGNELLEDLNNSTADTPGDAISPKLNDLPPPHCPGTVGICLPFKVTRLSSGPKPLTATPAPSRLLLSIPTPETLARDSAKLPSGNLPKSSAVIASITPTLFLLMSIALIKLLLIPVVTISSTSVFSASSASCEYNEVESGKSTINDNKYLYTDFPLKINEISRI